MGREFYEALHGPLAQVEEACRACRRRCEDSKAARRIGYTYLHLDKLTTSWIRSFSDGYPDCPVFQIFEGGPESLLEGVDNGTYSAVVLGCTRSDDVPPHLRKHLVWVTDEKIMMASEHRLATRDSLCFEDVAGEPFAYPYRSPSPISSPVRRDFIARGVPQRLFNAEFDASAFDLVAAGEAIIDIPVMWPVEDGRLVAVPYVSDFRIHHYFVWNPATADGVISDLTSYIERRITGGGRV